MQRIKDLVYLLTCLAFSMIIGAGIYEHLAVWPQAFAAPPSSLTMFQGDYGLAGGDFWRFIHPVALSLFVIALILHWNTPRRNPLLVSFGGYILLMVATVAWFLPEMGAVAGAEFAASVDPDLQSRGQTWILLSWIRQITGAFLALYLFWGLTRAPEPVPQR